MGIAEEEEGEEGEEGEEDEDVEEVDEFSPVIGGVEEVVEESGGGEETGAGAESPQPQLSDGSARGLGLQGEGKAGGPLLLGKLLEEREPPSPVPEPVSLPVQSEKDDHLVKPEIAVLPDGEKNIKGKEVEA